MMFRGGTGCEVLGEHGRGRGGRRHKWKSLFYKVGAGRTGEENTCCLKPVINDHKERKIWRLKIPVVICHMETMKYP